MPDARGVPAQSPSRVVQEHSAAWAEQAREQEPPVAGWLTTHAARQFVRCRGKLPGACLHVPGQTRISSDQAGLCCFQPPTSRIAPACLSATGRAARAPSRQEAVHASAPAAVHPHSHALPRCSLVSSQVRARQTKRMHALPAPCHEKGGQARRRPDARRQRRERSWRRAVEKGE